LAIMTMEISEDTNWNQGLYILFSPGWLPTAR
jgi:hypothetical protein